MVVSKMRTERAKTRTGTERKEKTRTRTERKGKTRTAMEMGRRRWWWVTRTKTEAGPRFGCLNEQVRGKNQG
ncbi:hypothetical protein ACH9L7_18660 (plasmid) [Haloferax sp. S1W]|uniref:hypothetical protein n=1 Tax=Haloferax sp. S1W TaxID=3377110 RepID=UPI0037C9C8B9